MPAWAVRPLPADIPTPRPGEELCLRGYLLPRIARFGARAPLLNVALFSLYHVWTPWDLGLRTVLLLPMVDATWRTRDIRIAVLAHCGINTLGFVPNSGPTLLAG